MVSIVSTYTREKRREMARHLANDNKKFGVDLVDISSKISENGSPAPSGLVAAFRSKDYLVQVFKEDRPPALYRLSVNRTVLAQGPGGWGSEISWEDLQRIKSQCGFGGYDAVEVYPHDLDVVNVSNMRHLWVLKEPLSYAWRKDSRHDQEFHAAKEHKD